MNFYRQDVSDKNQLLLSDQINDVNKKMMELIKENLKITQRELGEKLNLSKITIQKRQKNYYL